MITSSVPDDASGCGTSKEPGCIKSILGNSTAIKMYANGIPTNGKPVPDGAKMAKIHWTPKKNPYFPDAMESGTLHDVDFMVKNSKRFGMS
jgi:hypothetical protein